MMDRKMKHAPRTRMDSIRLAGWLALIAILPCTGCVGLATQLLYVIKGHQAPAAYDGLKNQRVAVICIADSRSFGPNPLADTVSRSVGSLLASEVKKVTIIAPSEIENWIDRNGWDEKDFYQIGQGVKADKVVAIEMGGYSIREGQTLYKGRCELTVSVFDIKNGGSLAFSQGPKEYAFPQNGRPAIQTTERKFEAMYLGKLTKHVATLFYKHDALETVAEEATLFE